jgi:hypothetical protein
VEFGLRPVLVKEVVALVPINVPFRYIRYSVTPILSVEAVQVKVTCVSPGVPTTLVGAVGSCRSAFAQLRPSGVPAGHVVVVLYQVFRYVVAAEVEGEPLLSMKLTVPLQLFRRA